MPLPNFSTAGDLITQARKEAKIGTNPRSSALQTTELLQRIVDLDGEGIAYPTKVGFLGFWFNDKEQIIQTKANTTPASAIASGAVSLTLTSGTGWDSPSSDLGAGYIKNGNEIFDFFAFESRSSGVLSVVNGIQIAHTTSEEIHKLYKLNADFGWPRNLFRESKYLTYRQQTASRRQVPAGGSYTIKYIESTNYNGLFVIFPEDIGALDWTMLYQKAAVTTATESTKMSLPGVSHGRRYYIEGLKEYMYHDEGNSEDEAKAAAQKQFHLDSLLSEYGIEDMSGDQSIVVPDA